MSDFIPVRFSHLLGFAGIGAIVRAERYLYTVIDTRKWPLTFPISYLERVRCALRLEDKQLHAPPKGRENSPGSTLPGIRFPSWMRCNKCGLMHWQAWNQAHNPIIGPCCTQCSGGGQVPLDQYPWLIADSEGRMDDAPWHWLLHRDDKCRHDWKKPSIILKENNTGKRWTLKCAVCGKDTPQDEHINEKTGLMVFKHQPWLGNQNIAQSVDSRAAPETRLVDVSNPGLYSVPMCSALVIPPESRVQRGSVIDQLYRNGPALAALKNARNNTRRDQEARKLAGEFRCSREDLIAAWQEIEQENGYPLYGEIFTPGQMHEDEFKAFLTPSLDQREDEDLVTFSHTNAWNSLSAQALPKREAACIPLLQELIEVRRLREIRVFKGFSRLGGVPLVPPDIVGETNWLPAIELFGEGIFLVLSETMLKKWELQQAVIDITESLQKRFESTGLADQVRRNGGMEQPANGRITPRFVLLHTLAHLLIRQFETAAGYPAASLKERIYSGENMAGILVYVSVADVAGSLGGLSELARPTRFLSVLSETFKKAEWCSFDPVCSEHEWQGPHQLNRSACHGCALIPEPSCVVGNEILDRTFVKGDPKKKISSPLEFVEHD
jgi:Domain of unknown function (DUF1998)